MIIPLQSSGILFCSRHPVKRMRFSAAISKMTVTLFGLSTSLLSVCLFDANLLSLGVTGGKLSNFWRHRHSCLNLCFVSSGGTQMSEELIYS